MMRVQERYETDPAFRRLVDIMETAVMSGEYTPTEIREAAMFAQIKWESIHLRRSIYVTERELENLDAMRR